MIILCSGVVTAQEQHGISLGQTKILPTLGITFGHDDNLTFANDNEIESEFFVISPGVRWEIPSDNSILTFTYEAELGRYTDSSIDDYDDQLLRADYLYDPTSRTDIGLFAELREGHDGRGTGARQGDLGLLDLEPDEYDVFGFGGYWHYGAAGARGRLELEASHSEREYDNNREFTIFRDREEDHLGGAFFLRIRPKTAAFLEVSWTDIDYDFASLDNEETHYFAGIRWELTARTAGTVKYGHLKKDFDDPSRENYSGSTWGASIEWKPRTYSTFTLTATKETEETDGFGDFILRDDISLDWVHDWSSRFNTTVEIGFGTDDHRPNIRKDDVNYWGISGRWQLNRHIQLGIGWTNYDRDSSVSEFNYDRNVWRLTFEGSL